MPGVFRSIFAVVAGFVAASAIMMAVECVNGQILYPELGKSAAGVTDIKKIKEIMASAPVGALVVARSFRGRHRLGLGWIRRCSGRCPLARTHLRGAGHGGQRSALGAATWAGLSAPGLLPGAPRRGGT